MILRNAVLEILNYECAGWKLFPADEDVGKMEWDEYNEFREWRENALDRWYEENKKAFLIVVPPVDCSSEFA
jgi:hypothetical protein